MGIVTHAVIMTSEEAFELFSVIASVEQEAIGLYCKAEALKHDADPRVKTEALDYRARSSQIERNIAALIS